MEYRKKTEEKFKNFTIEVIDFLLSFPEAVAQGFDRKAFYRLMSGYESTKILTLSNICKLFHNLKNGGYVFIEKSENNQESIIFTNKAKISVIDRSANRREWDGKYRLVSFDIPETLKINRNCFRRAIKRIGFRQIQKSLWICERNVGDLVEMVAEEYKVECYVVYFIADKSNIDIHIQQIVNKNKTDVVSEK